MSQFTHLLAPGKIGNLQLKNHVIMGPTETLYATAGGEVTRPIIDYYVRRAKGGAGLIVLHSAQGNTKIDPIDPYPGSLRLDDNAFIPMLSQLTEEVHRAGAKIAALVSAGGGAQAMGYPYDHGSQGIRDVPNVGPSEKRSMVANRPVRKLTVEEIKASIEAYGLCAARAKASGFDAFYIHAVGGYLISEFMTPYFNDRDDEYGGCLENRMRFLLELIQSCQDKAGKDFPLIVRMSIDEFMGEAGRGVEESQEIGRMLEKAGVAAIDCSAAIFESMHMLIPPIYLPQGCLVPLAEAMKAAVSIPVITQGRLYDPELAESVLRDGKADFISLSRAWIVEPDWVRKVQAGDIRGMRKCLSCNHCIGGRVLSNLPLRCAFNPQAGRESQPDAKLVKAAAQKKVVVIGGGPAGMEAAYILGLRGHLVDLYEAGDKLGAGQLDVAMLPPGKAELKNVTDFFEAQFERLENVTIHLSSPITADSAKELAADVILVATGATPLIPNIPGIEGENICTADQVLRGEKTVSGNVVVAGGGQIGVETAHALVEQGCKVTIIEMLPAVAMKEELITMLTIVNILQTAGVTMLVNTKINSFDKNTVKAESTVTGEAVDVPFDHVVLAFGTKSEHSAAEYFSGQDVICIGDAESAGNIRSAIESGYFTALSI